MEGNQTIEIVCDGDRDELSSALERSNVYLPTLEEIAAACKEIQAGWTPEVKYSRLRGWQPE